MGLAYAEAAEHLGHVDRRVTNSEATLAVETSRGQRLISSSCR